MKPESLEALLLWIALLLIVAWLPLAVAVGAAARVRGYAFFPWFVLAVIASPFLAGLFLVLLFPVRDDARRRREMGGE
jgi:hypothetical protein